MGNQIIINLPYIYVYLPCSSSIYIILLSFIFHFLLLYFFNFLIFLAFSLLLQHQKLAMHACMLALVFPSTYQLFSIWDLNRFQFHSRKMNHMNLPNWMINGLNEWRKLLFYYNYEKHVNELILYSTFNSIISVLGLVFLNSKFELESNSFKF